MKSREPFGLFLRLLAHLDATAPRDVADWFLAGADSWARSVDRRDLAAHLGLTHRLRRDYLQDRLQRHLDDALQAFVATHSGSAWHLAGEFLRVLKAHKAMTAPGESQLSRSLFAAFSVGLPIPRSRRHWFERLKPIAADGSVDPAAESAAAHDHEHEAPMTDTVDLQAIETEARQRWQSDPALRAEFGGQLDEYVAFVVADARGQVKFQRPVQPR